MKIFKKNYCTILKNGKIEIGQIASTKKIWKEEDVKTFAELCGDFNRIHFEDNHPIFKHRVVHGMLTASLFSRLIGMKIPGSIYVTQNLNFKKPVYLNEEITATVKVEKIKKSFIIFTTTAFNSSNQNVIEGEAVAKVPIEYL